MGIPVLNMDGYLLKQIKQNTTTLTQETAARTAADAALQQELADLKQAGVSSLILSDLNTQEYVQPDATIPLQKVGNTFVSYNVGVGTTYHTTIGKKEYGVLGIALNGWSSYTNSGNSICRCTVSIIPRYYTDGSTTAYLRLPASTYVYTGLTGNISGFSSSLMLSQILSFENARQYSFGLNVSLEWFLADGDTIKDEPTELTVKTSVYHQISD